MTGAIELNGLTKSFGEVLAVDDVRAVALPGQVTALLGPNGAGKTTALRMLLGLVAPDCGVATFGGKRYDELRHPARQVGAVLEASGYHPGRTALDHLRILATASRLAPDACERVLAETGLASDARRRVGGFSLGMRQRLGIAAAMLGDPAVLVLDEPTNGLDPPGVRWLRGYVRRLADEGRTVLLSSHALSEVELIADHVLVLAQGDCSGPRPLPPCALRRVSARWCGPRTRTGSAPPSTRRTSRTAVRTRGWPWTRHPSRWGSSRGSTGSCCTAGGDRRPGAGLLPIDQRDRPGGASSGRRGVVVKALLQAELLKLRSTRTTAGLLLATLGLVGL